MNNVLNLWIFLSALSLVTLCRAQLRSCLRVISEDDDATSIRLDLLRDSHILPQFYAGKGPCKDLVYARSFRIGLKCIDLDVTTGKDQKAVAECRSKTDTYLNFKKCVWNKKTVSSGGISVSLQRKRNYETDKLYFGYFKEKKCQVESRLGQIFVQIEEPEEDVGLIETPAPSETLPDEPSDLSSCVYLKSPSKNGKSIILGIYRDARVLPEFYDYGKRGRCRDIVHTDSFKVDGVCVNFDVHGDQFDVRDHCKTLVLLKTIGKHDFRKCYWNSQTVDRQLRINVTEAQVGGLLLVELFDKKDCTKKFDEGYILVQE